MATANLLFNKYSYEDVVVSDETLRPYLRADIAGIVPHTSSKISLGRFGLVHKSITERFTTHFMSHGRNNGKKRLALKMFEASCDIVHKLSGENPIQALVNAVINAGPREISARIGKGGNMRRASVDVSPYRRINIALSFLAQGFRNESFKNKATLPEVVAHEIINASKNSTNSYAVKKREEVERIAKSNR